MSRVLLVPFDEESGDLCATSEARRDVTLRPNFEFSDTLTFDSFVGGNTRVVMLRCSSGASVGVFLGDFAAMVPHLVRGGVTGTFTFVKRGTHFGCRLVRVQ
jgi:hypothetical protein